MIPGFMTLQNISLYLPHAIVTNITLYQYTAWVHSPVSSWSTQVSTLRVTADVHGCLLVHWAQIRKGVVSQGM